jgi:hypothetical protein
MPWRAASSASSRGVQWLIGRPASDGGVQARAMIRQSCSGVNVGGAPDRGASASTPRTTAWSARSSPAPPSSSAATRASLAAAQRPRHAWTTFRVTPKSFAIRRLLVPSAAASTTRARVTNPCGLVLARTTCSSTCRCRSVTRIASARDTVILLSPFRSTVPSDHLLFQFRRPVLANTRPARPRSAWQSRSPLSPEADELASHLQSTGIWTSVTLPGVAAATAAAISESLLLMSLHRPLPRTTIAIVRFVRFCW